MRIDPATKTFQACGIVGQPRARTASIASSRPPRPAARRARWCESRFPLEDRIVKHTRSRSTARRPGAGAEKSRWSPATTKGPQSPGRGAPLRARQDGLMEHRLLQQEDVRNTPSSVKWTTPAASLWKSVFVACFLVLVLPLVSAWQHFELLRHAMMSKSCSASARPRTTHPPAEARDRHAQSPKRSSRSRDQQLHLVRLARRSESSSNASSPAEPRRPPSSPPVRERP